MSYRSSYDSMESTRCKRPRLSGESTVGQYRITRTIFEGKFRKIMLAEHIFNGQTVAIKKMDKAPLTPDNVRYLYKEADIMKTLNHPNIVKLLDVFDSEECLYLVMEYAAGGDLYGYLEDNGSLDENEARRMFREIVSAIEYCHQKGIIHRDITIENILLDSNMNIKVADFGESDILATDSKLEGFCGTLECMAPEIILREKYGSKVDVWSLGVLLYCLVANEDPFTGPTDKYIQEKILRCSYGIPPFVGTDCANLIRNILKLDPEKRPTLELVMQDKWINSGYECELKPYVELESHLHRDDEENSLNFWNMMPVFAQLMIYAHCTSLVTNKEQKLQACCVVSLV